jgi:hypothetical protein
MWLIGAVVLGTLLLGYGVGSALTVALIACAVMIGSIFWFVRRAEQAPRPQQAHQDDLQPH